MNLLKYKCFFKLLPVRSGGRSLGQAFLTKHFFRSLPYCFSTMTERRAKKIINFAPGPAKLPKEVIDEAQRGLQCYGNTGLSIMELSHRTPAYDKINQGVQDDLREILNVPNNYKILFVQGGGCGQFAFVPMNLMKAGGSADYLVTGTWSSKAAIEAEKHGKVNYVFPKPKAFTTIPDVKEWKLTPDASYVYYCDNETVNGVEFPFIPDTKDIPLVCDMSSNFLTRPFDVSKYGCIVAGAQKNVGCPGVTVVIIREDLLGRSLPYCPTAFDYKVVAKANSLYNTPPTFSVYVMGLVLKWIKKQGGLPEMVKRSAAKSSALYEVIDSSKDFYISTIDRAARSRMNVVFRIKNDEELENKFDKEADDLGYVHVKGHRSVGGMRVSLYNAVSLDEVHELLTFMKAFQERNKK